MIQVSEKNRPDLFENAAWEYYQDPPFSLFLATHKPVLSLFYSSIVRWDSYEDPKLIEKDIRNYGIEHIITIRDGKVVALTPENYAAEEAKRDRLPQIVAYDYGFPMELKYTNYKKLKEFNESKQ